VDGLQHNFLTFHDAISGLYVWPVKRRPRRIMTDMLGVPAFQFGNPIALIVLSKGDNPALHKDY
jgi:hypothetical protein